MIERTTLLGRSPRGESGRVFARGWYAWYPLWAYAHTVAPDLCLSACGHCHGGHALDEDRSNLLADRLQAELDAGRTADEEDGLLAAVSALRLEPCETCKGSGVVAEGEPLEGESRPRCSDCLGAGGHIPLPALYMFDEQLVQDFVIFLRTCGGFWVF